jgi:uncharacterized protein (TIGR00297 family)
MQIALGFGLAAVAAGLAYRLGSLSRSGALAAVLLGTLVFGWGGLEWAILLIAFFGSSSALTRLFARRKQDLAATFSKGGQRDAGQVLANGGLAGLCVIAHALWPGQAWPWLAFSGSLAAVNADTWATELGVLNPTLPRLITTFQEVPRGTSGGVSRVGTLAAAAGALWIAAFALLLGDSSGSQAIIQGLVITLAGLAGSLVDSLLGATLQAIYYCPTCQRETERHPWHTCGTETTLVRGLPWLGNDGVNLVCALIGGLAALLALVL